MVHIAVHGGQKQQNAAHEEWIPQLTGIDITTDKDHRFGFVPFLIRYFSVELPSERGGGRADERRRL